MPPEFTTVPAAPKMAMPALPAIEPEAALVTEPPASNKTPNTLVLEILPSFWIVQVPVFAKIAYPLFATVTPELTMTGFEYDAEVECDPDRGAAADRRHEHETPR